MIQLAVATIRASLVLTTSYVVGSVLGIDVSKPDIMQTSNQAVLLVDFTKGSLATAEIKVEFSDDKVNWYQESFGAVSGGNDAVSLGVHVLSASGKYRIPIALKDRFVRVSTKGTGTLTNSLMAIKAVVGNS